MAKPPKEDPMGRAAIGQEFQAKLRGQVPAQLGGFSRLLERLEVGTASAADQKWAAKLLRMKPPSPRITEQAVRNGEDWQLYFAVLHLLEKDPDRDRDKAYKQLEGKIPARNQKNGHDSTLNRETIKGRFLAMEKLSEELDAWADENPELAHPDRV